MAVYARVSADSEDWFIETSSTAGLQAPLKSVNKERLVSAAFSLGSALSAGAKDGYAWVSFCRWTRDSEHGMEEHVDETYQLVFTRHGAAILKNWQEVFMPKVARRQDRPVLIYNYDQSCYLFCDVAHFLRIEQAWTVFAGIFGVASPPIARAAPEGNFADILEYMSHYPEQTTSDGDPVRPHFQN